ncbi:hypothetical protein B566_EDAN017409 [Ephemera danica]|nr:hypothetical protein B566_EDAN017409 [Ephemera danica]
MNFPNVITMVFRILVLVLMILTPVTLAIQKCCPHSQALSPTYQGTERKYCVPYQQSNFDGQLPAGLKIPQTTRDSMHDLLNNCKNHKSIQINRLSIGDHVTRLSNGDFQLTMHDGVMTLTPDSCMDLMVSPSPQLQLGLVVLTCPCSKVACMHLCCPNGELGYDDGPCGAPWSAWETALHPVYNKGIAQLSEQPEATCLREGPLGGIAHPTLRSTSSLQRVSFDEYIIAGRHLSSSQFCLGLPSVEETENGAIPSVQVYYCDSPNSGGTIVNNPRWTADEDMSAEHVTWLCVVAAALTVAVLAFSALNKDGLAGFCLILYCLILLVAIFALAYAPIAVALPGVFSTPSHDCQILGHVMHFAFLASFLLLLFRVNLIFTTMRSARMTAWCRNKESASCAKLLPKLLILGTLVVAVAFALGALGGRMGGAKLGYYENIVTIDQCWFPNQNWFLILYTLPLAVSVAISYILLAAVCLRMRAVTGETAQLKAGNNLPSPGQIRADQKRPKSERNLDD